MIKNRVLKLSAIFLSGVFVALGFPTQHFPIQYLGVILPFSLVALFCVIESLPKTHLGVSILPNRQALHVFFCLWAFGFVTQILAFFWISQPMIYFTSLDSYFAYPLFLLISLLTALYFPCLFSPLIFRTWYCAKYPEKKISNFLLVITFVLLEITIPRFFNWTFAALMHDFTYINQISSVFGFNCVSLFIFYTNLSLATLITKAIRNKKVFTKEIFYGLSLNVFLWGCLILFGYYRVETLDKILMNAPKTRIAYVQPNFTFSSEAFLPLPAKDSQIQSLSRLFEMSEEAINKSFAKDGLKPDLLVWPESAVSNFFLINKKYISDTQNFISKIGVPVLLQTTKWKREDLLNLGFEKAPVWSVSFVMFPNGDKSGEYAKWVPMPFGESFPLETSFPLLGDIYRSVFKNASKVEIGTSYESLEYGKNLYVAPLICFDSIDPNLARLEALKGKASIYVNQANLVWMVNSNAGLEISVVGQFRAIENARSFLMAANSGPTMAFDPLGRKILQPTTLLTQHVGFVDLPIFNETTLYSRFSHWPLVIFIFLSYLFLLLKYQMRKQHVS